MCEVISMSTDISPDEEFNNHIWVGGGDFKTDEFRRNILPFVKRHDFTLALTDYSMDPDIAGEGLRPVLEELKEEGIDVWLSTGIIPGSKGGPDDGPEFTDEELLADEEKMDHFLQCIEQATASYEELYPDGKIILMHEEPIMSNWAGDTYHERAESMIENGPQIFDAMKDRVEVVSSDLDVGFFPHDIVMAEPEHSTIPTCERLMPRMEELDALPDFIYVDSYRGWYEWATGHEEYNEYVESILSNIKEHTHGRPVYYLGAAHSINNNYTPSQQAIYGNLQSTLDNDIDGAGWYFRTRYKKTSKRNYDPFVPNEGEIDDQSKFTSFTGSRDRLLYANLMLVERREDFDRDERFDLWVYGEDFDFYEHGLSLQTADGDYEFIGDFNGYNDGDTPYAGGDRKKASIFHALDRSTFLDDGELTVRIEGGGDGGELESIRVMPYAETDVYVTELEATDLVERGVASKTALGGWDGSESLEPDSTTEMTVAVSESEAPITDIVRGDQPAAFERMRELEANESTRDYFDLWVYGEDLSGLETTANETTLRKYADDSAAETFNGGVRAVVYRGLPKDEFLRGHAGGQFVDLGLDGDWGSVDAVFAMPCHGATAFKSDREAATTVARDYESAGQIETFALGHQTWSDGASLADGVETWLHVTNRRAIGGARH